MSDFEFKEIELSPQWKATMALVEWFRDHILRMNLLTKEQLESGKLIPHRQRPPEPPRQRELTMAEINALYQQVEGNPSTTTRTNEVPRTGPGPRTYTTASGHLSMTTTTKTGNTIHEIEDHVKNDFVRCEVDYSSLEMKMMVELANKKTWKAAPTPTRNQRNRNKRKTRKTGISLEAAKLRDWVPGRLSPKWKAHNCPKDEHDYAECLVCDDPVCGCGAPGWACECASKKDRVLGRKVFSISIDDEQFMPPKTRGEAKSANFKELYGNFKERFYGRKKK